MTRRSDSERGPHSIGDIMAQVIAENADAITGKPASRAQGRKGPTPRQLEFIDQVVAINNSDVHDRDALGFSARVLVQASLPHRTPKKGEAVWIRRNGNFALQIQPGYTNAGKCIGFPFGNIPRLVLTYLTTQAVQTRQRDIDLGNSLASFMHAIGLHSNGLHIRRLKNQMQRLFSANISFSYDDQSAVYAHEKRPVARRVLLWWDDKAPSQQALFNSSVLLDEEFFKEILEHPVPIDMGAIAALKQSSLALDLYTWLTHRVTYLKKPQRIAWVSLQQQMGSEYASTKDFAKRTKITLRKVYAVYPELKIEDVDGGFIIKPSRPHVPLIT